MSQEKNIHENLTRITKNIGGFDWDVIGDIDTPIGNYEDIWSIYISLEKIHEVMDSVYETLYFMAFHLRINTNINVAPIFVLNTCINNTIGAIRYYDKPKRLIAEILMAKDMESIFKAFNSSGFNLMQILKILKVTLFKNYYFYMPSNKLEEEVECAFILFILVKYKIIKNITAIKNDN